MTTDKPIHRHPTAEIKRHSQGHFFDRGAKRFFNSHISEDAFRSADGTVSFFVTSERFDSATPRYYSVRRYTWATDDFDIIGRFQAYANRATAASEARRLAIDPTQAVGRREAS
jgi:hypothetical protein